MRKYLGISLFSACILITSITFADTSINYTNRQQPQILRILQTAQEENKPLNELGFTQDEDYISDIKGYWTYSSLHYYRFTDYGIFGARFNYANKYGIGGEQYQLEAYPKLVKNFYFIKDSYLSLLFAKSNTSQRVYPQYQYTIEPYLYLPCGYELSFGQRYLRTFGVNIYTYTGSIGKNIGNYFVWLRPYHYTPKSVDFWEGGVRHYFDDPKTYVSIKAGIGKTPDIGDVPPLNQIIILSDNEIGVDGEMPIAHNLFLQGSLTYLREIYHSGHVREITDGSLGLVWQF